MFENKTCIKSSDRASRNDKLLIRMPVGFLRCFSTQEQIKLLFFSSPDYSRAGGHLEYAELLRKKNLLADTAKLFGFLFSLVVMMMMNTSAFEPAKSKLCVRCTKGNFLPCSGCTALVSPCLTLQMLCVPIYLWCSGAISGQNFTVGFCFVF